MTDAPDLPRCRECHAPIVHAVTTGGRPTLLDRESVEDGDVVWTGRKVDNGNDVLVLEVRPEQPSMFDAGGTRFNEHHCPTAGSGE